MREMQYILALFLLEVLIFLTEVLFSFINKKNKLLKQASLINDVNFIDLSEGYRTSISFFRVSLFIAYLILIFIYLDMSENNSFEKLVMIIILGILIYLVSLFNVKTFIFYTDYFIITAPFNFFQKDVLINYNSISDFKLYRALYNSYYLKLEIKNKKARTIQFSGSFNPRNDLVIRIIINTKAELKKDFSNVKSYNKE